MKRLFLAILIISLFCFKISVAYDNFGASCKAVGMGNAFTAISDDPGGIFYNPAGLAWLRNLQVSVMYAKLTNFDLDFPDKPYVGSGALVYPVRENFTLGLGGVQRGSWEYNTNVVTNNSGALALAGKITPNLSFGASAKYLFNTNADKETGFDLDLGLLFKATPQFSLGLAGNNLLQPDMGISPSGPGFSLIPTRQFKAGLAYAFKQNSSRTILAFDTSFRNRKSFTDNGNINSFGLEQTFMSDKTTSFAVRGGYSLGKDFGLDYNSFALGLSVKLNKGSNAYQIDYSYQDYPYPGTTTLTGDHRVSLTVVFGVKKPVPEMAKKQTEGEALASVTPMATPKQPDLTAVPKTEKPVSQPQPEQKSSISPTPVQTAPEKKVSTAPVIPEKKIESLKTPPASTPASKPVETKTTTTATSPASSPAASPTVPAKTTASSPVQKAVPKTETKPVQPAPVQTKTTVPATEKKATTPAVAQKAPSTTETKVAKPTETKPVTPQASTPSTPATPTATKPSKTDAKPAGPAQVQTKTTPPATGKKTVTPATTQKAPVVTETKPSSSPKTVVTKEPKTTPAAPVKETKTSEPLAYNAPIPPVAEKVTEKASEIATQVEKQKPEEAQKVEKKENFDKDKLYSGFNKLDVSAKVENVSTGRSKTESVMFFFKVKLDDKDLLTITSWKIFVCTQIPPGISNQEIQPYLVKIINGGGTPPSGIFWDKKSKGIVVPPGTYYYALMLTGLDEKSPEGKRWLSSWQTAQIK